MYRELSVEHSLFMIDPILVEEFQQYSQDYHDLQPAFNLTHSEVDTWAAAFNHWLLLISQEEYLIIDHIKTFSHTVNIFCIQEIEKTEMYLMILDRFTRKERFVVACFLTDYVHAWKRKIMEKHAYDEMLMRNLCTKTYYLVENIELSQMTPELQIILENQAKLVKLLVKEIQEDCAIECCIEKSIIQAKAFLRYRSPNKNDDFAT